jgi:hypothetical protein
MYVNDLSEAPRLMEAGRRLDNRAAVEVDTSGAKIGPVLRLLPVAQATPARHSRPAPEFLRKHLPRNTAAKDEDNACEARAIRDARPPTLWQSWGNWQERFDKIPQRIWKQRGGHACSRYLADEDEGSEKDRVRG